MPPGLAHQALDKAIDLCYRPQPFINETKRIEFLFELYDKYTSGLLVKEKKKKKSRPLRGGNLKYKQKLKNTIADEVIL